MFFLAGCGGGVNTPVTSDFPSLTKTLGDAPFALATPESSDPTPFTYTSDDRAVATIAGDIVTLVGPGTVKITASQIKNNFPIVVKTALLTVAPAAVVPVPVAKTLILAADAATAMPAFGSRVITITVNSTGAPAAGTEVSLAASCGSMLPASVSTDATGTARASYIANPASNDGCAGSNVTLTASATGLNPVSATITVQAALPATMQLNLDSATPLAAFGNRNIAVTVKSNGAKVPSEVNFTASCGSVSPAKAAVDANGIASASFTANSSANDGCGSKNVTITVVATGATTVIGSIAVQAVPPPVLQLNVNTDLPLAAFGTRPIVVNVAGNGSKTATEVSISASCGTVSPAKVSSDVTGVVNATYLANPSSNDGCGGSNVLITASAGAAAALPVTGTITVQPAQPANVLYVGATPSMLYLKGSGAVEKANLIFRVVDAAGSPLGNQAVFLSLATTTSDVSIGTSGSQSPVVLTTGSNGQVAVSVYAGARPTFVQVNAALVARPAISVNSIALPVASGVPSQKYTSMALEKFSIEGLNNDGVSTNVSFSLADRLGNPVPVGTSVNFVTSHGVMIPATCTVPALADGTSASSCSSSLRSQGTRPIDGIVTVLAYAVGAEDFVDLNGDNMYTPGEPFTDIGNAFRDDDRNNEFRAGEFFVARPGAASGTPSCTASTDSVPSKPSTCDGVWGPNEVRIQRTVAFASGGANIFQVSTSLRSGLSFAISDLLSNSLPTGTRISVAGVPSDSNHTCSTTPSIATVSNTAGSSFVSIIANQCLAKDTVAIAITSPLGIVTTRTFIITP